MAAKTQKDGGNAAGTVLARCPWIKRGIKKLYIVLAKFLGVYQNVLWHATTAIEKRDIEDVFGRKGAILVANNLTATCKDLTYSKPIKKKKGELKLVFISRVHPKKNLKKAIELLQTVEGKIDFNIYGPIEDKQYWAECEDSIGRLGENINVLYKGVAAHEEILDILREHHVFILPTLGENFGHVISEALIGGCPVILSDRTPWMGLEEKKVGWDIALSDEHKFIETLQYCVDIGGQAYKTISENAFEYGKREALSNEKNREAYLELFGRNVWQ